LVTRYYTIQETYLIAKKAKENVSTTHSTPEEAPTTTATPSRVTTLPPTVVKFKMFGAWYGYGCQGKRLVCGI